MLKIKQTTIDFLIFTRFINGDGNLSITNIACIIVLYKLCVSSNTSAMDAGTLLIALSHYGYKKFLNQDTINQAAGIAKQLVTKAETMSSEKE